MSSLWGEEFDIKSKVDKNKALISKVDKPKKVEVTIEKKLKSKSVSIEDKIASITDEVNRILGVYKNDTQVIYSKDELIKFINIAINNGILSIDTETNNTLDTMNCSIMGLCLYTPNCKNTYVPINHIDRFSNERFSYQLTEKDIFDALSILNNSNIKILTHNGKFDYKVLHNTVNWDMPIYWDTMIGAKLLNENERAGLKQQYIEKIDPTIEKYSIDHLFKDIKYELLDPELFALYAATDAYMTYKLYEYQLVEFEKPENKDIFNLLIDIEIPIITVVANMELRGIEIDVDYSKRLSIEYHKRSDEVQKEIDLELEKLASKIESWKLTPEANEHPPAKNASGIGKSKAEKLSNPIDLGSPTQMAILLYDILKVGVVDKDSPRGTGAEILEKLSSKIPLCALLVKKRGIDILINTFIDKIPELVNNKTKRLHANFNTYGADTGRFSSSDPNLQNIPSHSKEIRLMFKAKDNYSIVGADYSAQEPRCLASFSNDKNMLDAYDQDKDLYALIGSKCFHNNYEDNLEFNPITKELQPEGKARRSKAKTIQLAISYSMGSKALAEKINVSKEEANKIIEDFYNGFEGVKRFTLESQKMLKDLGYVTDLWGRRRHIPNAQLEEFEIIPVNKVHLFNPLLNTNVSSLSDQELSKINSYKFELSKLKSYKDIDELVNKIKSSGYSVKDNRSLINRATRQCLNARIQSSAASMTKKAMIEIDKDKILNDLGFKLLITVHDEVFGECPRENSELAAKRLSEVMVNVAKEKCSCKFKCDGYSLSRWYEDELVAEIENDYSKSNSKDKIYSSWPMISKKYLDQIIDGSYICNSHSDI